MKFIILFFFVAIFNTAHATPLLDNQSSLRTLFTTPSERKQLNMQRSNGKYNNSSQTTGSTTVTRKPVTVKMQGVVIRKDKKPVVFVNDTNTLKSSRLDNELIINTRKLTKSDYNVPVQVNQTHVKLKPGQLWTESDNRVLDQYKIIPKAGSSDKQTTPLDNSDNTEN